MHGETLIAVERFQAKASKEVQVKRMKETKVPVYLHRHTPLGN